jgi:aspartyl-tRNA(Asn)/glutamyl-tRNA(Gln) amidotransferase subunit B
MTVRFAEHGSIEILVNGEHKKIGVQRIHMEEDAGKSLHEGFPDSGKNTYLDYNRSGVPLVEIVTKPDLAALKKRTTISPA